MNVLEVAAVVTLAFVIYILGRGAGYTVGYTQGQVDAADMQIDEAIHLAAQQAEQN